jgi:hypothetical protein
MAVIIVIILIMVATIIAILIPVIIILSITLYMVRKRISKAGHYFGNQEQGFLAHCAVCNTRVIFDSCKPLPKIWSCPSCGSETHTQTKIEDKNISG